MRNLILILPCLLASVSVQADDATDNKLFELPLEELLNVTVTVASHLQDDVRTAPSAVTVFNRDDLDRLGVRWLDELAPYVPGMRAQRTVGTGLSQWAYEFRGVPNVPGTNALLLIDGRRQNSPFSGNIVALYRRINLDAYARVEIIRGPGSALYGSNAMTGVINLVSRKDREFEIAGGGFGARYGSINEHAESGDVQLSLAAHAYVDDGDHYTNAFDPFRRDNATQDPEWHRESRMALDYHDWQMFAATSRNGMNDYYMTNALDDGYNHLNNSGYEYGLRAEQLHSPIGIWSLQWAVLDFDSAFQTKFADHRLPPFANGDWLFEAHGLGHTESFNLDALWTLGEQNNLSYGLEFRREHADFTLASNYDLATLAYLGGMVDQPDVLSDARRKVLGLYLEDRWSFSTHWSLNLGLRRDRYDDVGNATSPRVGVLWQAENGHSLKLLYAEAFRAPSLQELHFAANPRLLGNDDLQPVSSRHLDLVWLYAAQQLSSELTLYRLDQKHRIAVVSIAPALSQYENTGSLSVLGLEANMRYRLSDDWQTSFILGQILHRNENLGLTLNADEARRVTPDTLVTMALDGRHHHWQWHLSTQYNSGLEAAPQPAFWLTRARVAYDWERAGELAVVITNALDEHYSDVTDPSGFGKDDKGNIVRHAPERGRQAMLEYRYRW